MSTAFGFGESALNRVKGRWKPLKELVQRHVEAFGIVLSVIVPILLRTRRRPVMFSRYAGIGDIICTFPAVSKLKKNHSGAECIYNCHFDSVSLIRMGGVAQHVTSSHHIGLIGHWYAFLLSGFYQFRYDDDEGVTSSAGMIEEFGRQHGVFVGDAHPALVNAPSTIDEVSNLLLRLRLPDGPLIVIHPGPSWPVREWPIESWITLVEQLRDHGFVNIVHLGVGRHLAFGDVHISDITGAVSLVDKLTLEECTALISLADLFVGIDSGLLHIAPCVQTPAVGIWGPTSPKLRFSEADAHFSVTGHVPCLGCHHRLPRLHWITNCPFEIACMKSIPGDEILSACLKILKATNKILQPVKITGGKA